MKGTSSLCYKEKQDRVEPLDHGMENLCAQAKVCMISAVICVSFRRV